MIYKVAEDIIEILTKKLPFIRYGDARFFDLEESYYSVAGKKEIPWKNPKESIVHRLTAYIELNPKENNFDKNKKDFINFCNCFFDNSIPKTFSNAKHFLLVGDRENVQATEVAIWNVVEEAFNKANLHSYFDCSRLLINIPCGSLNLYVTKLVNSNDFYIEITSEDPDSNELDILINTLNLTNEIEESWAELAMR